MLRSRGLTARVAWFDHALPEVVDMPHNRSLLSTLGIDPASLAEADITPSGVDAGSSIGRGVVDPPADTYDPSEQ
ncbi:hypothetical protein ODJ79_46015 [Actinoplanes sp. KI2]|uniref:hypothetical protein n=1 Tax=Actinoplanes sp. KI2 TaxID=2983315 RepID=UPI0021D5B67C|nr:hypothetical protein [Actinoplanes sp. KI2]MCU7731114.1 hypothetical protein [Actinoplanes sp. KI2]